MYNVYNSHHEVVAVSGSQVAAFRMVDHQTRTDHSNGPFYCTPVVVTPPAAEVPAKRGFFARLFS